MTLEQSVIQHLVQQKKTLATAESCTGGLLFHRLTNIPGSSEILHFGINAYSNASKIKLLRVSPATIKQHGAVSEQTAVEMATRVRKILNNDFGIGITGIAGPTGGSISKPVGLVFIAVTSITETICLQCLFSGSRTSIKKQAADQALKLLLEFLR